MELKTIDKMTEELAKSLIGKHIHFTYHNKNEHTIEKMPGNVLDYQNGNIKIDTMDIIMIDDNTENTNMIQTFNIEDIIDIYPFNEEDYNHNYLEILDDVDDEDLDKTIYEIEVLNNEIVKAKITEYDFPLSIVFNISGNEIEYPLYFVKSIKRVVGK